MALYLKPPRGLVDYHVLQKCIDERLQFFKTMTCSSVSVHNIEYLTEDSAFDRAGHFTLRLAAVKDFAFLHYFVNSEVKLLKLRLDSLNGSSIRIFLKTHLRHARECIMEDGISEKVITLLNSLVAVITKMSSRSYRSHVFNEEHSKNNSCRFFILNVPFQHCSSLISKHRFDLRNGYVQIPCDNWKDLFMSFFNTYLKLAVNEMQYSKNVERALNDPRINSIVSSFCTNEDNGSNSSIILSQIDIETKFFPLCMQNLQGVLKKKHRLAHEERFNLSLFLKDIGVSLNDSIDYWKSEYSKEDAECSKCSHSWLRDEKRYIYSIRHMYGLEGSRKTYKTRSCSYFQSAVLSPMQEGGCPFKHFDVGKLKSLLSVRLNRDTSSINQILLERSNSPSRACKLFLKTVNSSSQKFDENPEDGVSGTSSGCDINFSDPVQYFMLMKSMS